MRSTETSLPAPAKATRIAWWACIAAPLVLLLILLAARPAAAAALPPEQITGPIMILLPSDSEEESEEEIEEFEAEEAEEEEEEAEEEAEEGIPPATCLLQTARAQAFAYPSRNKVRLLIHYTATDPTDATVVYRLKGDKGSVSFDQAKQHLERSGVIRLSENLSEGAMSKASAAKSFTVELHIADTPSYCRRFETRHLTLEHESESRVTWLQSESVFGT